MVKYNIKTAIITGANGFIGRHLIKELQLQDIQSIPLPRILLYSDVPRLTEFLFKHKPSYIFHLASYGNHGFQTDSTQAIMANWFGTYNLLKASEFLDYEAFINVATSSIYGKKDKSMKEVDYLQPDTFYAATKAGGIYLARAFAKQYNKPIATIIPFSVYGEGEADFRFIPTICKSLVTQQEMEFVKEPTHDWIYVKDFISGMLSVVDNIGQVQGDWINIGTGIATTNRSVIEVLEHISGRQVPIAKKKYSEQPHHSPLWVADNTRLKLLNWKPNYALREGLRHCWEYYQAKYENQE